MFFQLDHVFNEMGLHDSTWTGLTNSRPGEELVSNTNSLPCRTPIPTSNLFESRVAVVKHYPSGWWSWCMAEMDTTWNRPPLPWECGTLELESHVSRVQDTHLWLRTEIWSNCWVALFIFRHMASMGQNRRLRCQKVSVRPPQIQLRLMYMMHHDNFEF